MRELFFSPTISFMQNIIANIVEFFTREARSLLAIGIFVAIIYTWEKLSEKEQYYRWLVKINSRNAEAHYNLGLFLRDLPNRKAEAEKEFQQAIALHPRNSWAYYALYYLQVNDKRYEDAHATLDKMIEHFPKDGVTFSCQGNYYWRQKLFQEAETAYQKAISLTPNYHYIRYEYGRCLAEQQRHAEAESEFQTALRLQPSDADSHRHLGKVLEDTGRLVEAEAQYHKSIKLAPKNDQTNYDLWRLLKGQNRFSDAEKYFKRAALGRTGNTISYRFIVSSLWQQKKLEEAEKNARELVKLNPSDIDILLLHGHIFDDLNQNSEAERIYRQAIDKYPDNPNPYFHLGRIFEKAHQHKEAEEFYKKAIEIGPADAETHFNLGNVFTSQERYQEAEEVFRKAISLDAIFLPVYGSLANLLRKTGHLEEALRTINKGLEINPEEFYLNIGVASIQRSSGNIEEAKKYAEKSRLLIKKEDNENYWYDLACIECIVGNNELAFQYLANSAEENKLDRVWAWEDSDLEWIRNDPRFVEIVGPKPEN